MKLSVRSQSVKAINEALQHKIDSLPETKDGYNQSRPFRLALNEIEGNEHACRKNKHQSTTRKSARVD